MSRRSRRRRPQRTEQPRILVTTEGKVTEPQYLDRLKSHLRPRVVLKVEPVGKDPLRVVEKCIQLRDEAIKKEKPYQHCVSVVDVDEHSSLNEACKVAHAEQIQLLITNVKFETWLLWHVEDNRSSLSSSQLDRLMEKHGLLAGKKLGPGLHFDKVESACTIARAADPALEGCRRGPNPSSAMPILVDLLLAKR